MPCHDLLPGVPAATGVEWPRREPGRCSLYSLIHLSMWSDVQRRSVPQHVFERKAPFTHWIGTKSAATTTWGGFAASRLCRSS